MGTVMNYTNRLCHGLATMAEILALLSLQFPDRSRVDFIPKRARRARLRNSNGERDKILSRQDIDGAI